MNIDQKGFSPTYLIVFVLILGLIGFVGYKVFSTNDENKSDYKTNSGNSSKVTVSSGKCPDQPVIELPVDQKRIEAVLYPGQVRGNNFKPHGGFRLYGSNEAVIKLTADAKIVQGARYIESGEVQYMFDFETECKIRMRFDHLNTLSPTLQAYAEKLPKAEPNNSKTTPLDNSTLKKGTVLATKVGFIKNNNSSFDFGVYDMNKLNNASQQTNWPNDFDHQNENAKHAVCWLDWLPSSQQSAIKALPGGDGQQGKASVYCLGN